MTLQAPKISKRIVITQLDATTKPDELALKIDFKLQPTKTAFSRVYADLWFDNQLVHSALIKIPQGPLATDELEYGFVLDMTGIEAGVHTLRVEMYERWHTGARLCEAAKDLVVDYVPQNRYSCLVKVPTVKSVAGADLAVVNKSENDFYEVIDETLKKEQLSKRDTW